MTEGRFIQGQGGAGTFTIAGTEPWAITSGSRAAGIKFNTADFDAYTNAGDLELVSEQSTWTRQMVCVDNVSTSGYFRIVNIYIINCCFWYNNRTPIFGNSLRPIVFLAASFIVFITMGST